MQGTAHVGGRFVEDVQVRGHIIDSLILPKILDTITSSGGSFRIKQMSVGQARHDPSFALVEVSAPTAARLDEILASISDHGAVPVNNQDCRLEQADIDGAFPEGFYSTTNQRTEIRLDGKWMAVDVQEMDCGIVVDPAYLRARCVPMSEVRRGDEIAVGRMGIRVFPEGRQEQTHSFEFMNSAVSSEKPKGVAIRRIAQQLYRSKKEGGKTLLVGGPAIVHTGSSHLLCQLIRDRYIDTLFAGNALAAHDIEQAMFGTSLGVSMQKGEIIESGHEHHLRAINRIRRCGGIRAAVDQNVLTSGIMYECVRRGVDYVLAGSIRDDGPLPDVVTDVLQAQRLMREKVRDVTFCLMIATTLHSIAVGNLLPAWVNVVCVDINPSTVIKLGDRGSFQTVGLVTDVAPFMSQLLMELEALEKGDA
jgi:lysine-ketoglutarate reductase/saccharopine dehydrogenase-like protein (TIGR00300 family)